MSLTRRQFLSICGGMFAAAFLIACGSESAEPEVDEVVVPLADLPESDADPFHSDPGRFYLIRNDDGLLALYSKCTHQGCTVNWDGDNDEFHCPCHNSRFNRHGERTTGPAERPLDLMAITMLDDGNLRIDTDDISTRQKWSPDQSVKPSG